MIFVVVGNWWSLALRGLAAVAFGVIALVWPGLTLTALVLLFGFYVLFDGLATLASVITHRREREGVPWLLVLQGLAGVAVGIVTWAWPDVTALALLFLIAAWAFVIGVLEIVAAVLLRREMRHEWVVGLIGLLSIVFAVVLVAAPVEGALAITWAIGWFAIFNGVLLLALAYRVHKLLAPVRQDMRRSPRRVATA
jgi:uncharacterized membrane protein HdeD (DUF308 family)